MTDSWKVLRKLRFWGRNNTRSDKPAAEWQGPLKRRWLGYHRGWLTGAIAATETPEKIFHVRLVEADGTRGCSVRADYPDSGVDLPPGHGFRIPPPLDWLYHLEPTIHFQMEIVETGTLFPKKGARLPLKNVFGYVHSSPFSDYRSIREMETTADRTIAELRQALDSLIEAGSGKTLVLAIHELSRTGAPQIALAVANQLRERHGYRILVLNSRESGDLYNDYVRAGHIVVNDFDNALVWREEELSELMRELRGMTNGIPALVNSICTTPVARALRGYGWNVLALAHEFPNNFLKRQVKVFLSACDEVVFPCEMIRQSFAPWLDECHGEGPAGRLPGRPPAVRVMPQGCHMLDHEPPDPGMVSQLHELWRRKLDLKSGDRVVLACGTRDSRKGFDWWAKLAAHYRLNSPNGDRVAFVWIGGNRNHELHDSVIESLRQPETAARFLLLDALADPRPAYMFANLFLMCSRLDPFPNTVLEAMLHGLPVVGFDRGQGTADLVRESGIGRIVPFEHLESTAGALDEMLWDEDLAGRARITGPEIIQNNYSYRVYGDEIAGILKGLQPGEKPR